MINIERIIFALFGDNSRFPLRHRLFNFSLFLNIIVSLAVFIENQYMNNHILTIISTMLNLVITTILYYFSRKRYCFTIPVWINLIIDLFVITPVLWVFDGGTKGGSQYFIILFCMMIVAFIKGKKRFILLFIYLAVVLVLIMTEYHNPELIISYKNNLNRYQDVAFSMFVMLISMVIVFSIYIYAYEYEQHKVEKYSKEIEIERNKLKENERLMGIELNLAKNIQTQFVPARSPSASIDFFFRPMYMLGGDFLDFITFRDSEDIGIFISDVSGHGVPAALITAMIKSNLDEYRLKEPNTSELMSMLNSSLYNLTDGNFITCFYGIYRKNKRELSFTNAGHNSPYIITGDKVEELDISLRSVPLSIMNSYDLETSDKGYRENRVILEKGCKVLFFTDGLTEATNVNTDISNKLTLSFEKEVLIPLMIRIHDLPAPEFVKRITEELIIFRGSDDFDDDICIVCLDVV